MTRTTRSRVAAATVLLALSAGVAAARVARADAPSSAPATAPVGANAADLYREAADELLADLTAAELVVLDSHSEPCFDPEAAGALVRRKGPVLALIRRATTQPACDWDTDLRPDAAGQEPIRLYGRLRNVASFGALAARVELAGGRPEGAVDALLDTAALGRRVGAEPVLINKVVELGIEALVVEQLASALPTLPAPVVASLRDRWGALPPSASYADVIRGEYRFALDVGDQVAPAGATVAQVESAKSFYDAAAAAADKSPAEFAAAANAARAALPDADQAYATTLIPTFKAIRDSMAAAEARVAMLLAAADVVRRGPAALADHPDPFGDGPFQHAARGDGFELRSMLIVHGKQIKLLVSAPPEGG